MAHLNIVKEHAKIDSDICDHIEKIYLETLQFNPKLIVELGVRYGESTRIFNFVNNEINSRLISVDIVPYIRFDYTNIYNGTFYLMDDIKFGESFKNITDDLIDVLFIDTSHLYDHTVNEINTYFPLLNNKCLVIFHDTNLKPIFYWRNGRSCDSAWDNNRGVIRAIEEYFNIQVDETKDFELQITKDTDIWVIKHEYICNGLTLCYKN